jgi:hypothetical protein
VVKSDIGNVKHLENYITVGNGERNNPRRKRTGVKENQSDVRRLIKRNDKQQISRTKSVRRTDTKILFERKESFRKQSNARDHAGSLYIGSKAELLEDATTKGTQN